MKTFFAALLCVSYLSSAAQPISAVSSEPLEPLEWQRHAFFVPCHNGNTVYCVIGKGGVNVTVYNRAGKTAGQSMLSTKLWDATQIQKTGIDGLEEIDGNAVLFLEQKSILYRIVLSEENGLLLKEDKIAEMSAGDGLSGMLSSVSDKPTELYRIASDPVSSAYAVLMFDGYSQAREKRIELLHFDSTHKLLGRAYYHSNENNFSNILFVGMAVRGTDAVELCTYGYNSGSKPGDNNPGIIFSTLQGSKMTHIGVAVKAEDNSLRNMVRRFAYDPKNALAYELTTAKVDESTSHSMMGTQTTTTNYYESKLIAVNCSDHSFVYGKDVTAGGPLSAYRKEHYRKSEPYQGLTDDIVPNSDGTVSVLLEERKTASTGYLNLLSTTFGDLGIADYNAEGKPANPVIIAKRQLNVAQRYRYISNDAGRFVILLDNGDNADLPEGEMPAVLDYEKNRRILVCRITNGSVNRVALTGIDDDILAQSLDFENIRYCAATGDIVSIMTEKISKRDTDTRLLWIHLKQ